MNVVYAGGKRFCGFYSLLGGYCRVCSGADELLRFAASAESVGVQIFVPDEDAWSDKKKFRAAMDVPGRSIAPLPWDEREEAF